MKDKNEVQAKIDVFVKYLVDKTLSGDNLSDNVKEAMFEDLYEDVKEYFDGETDFFLFVNENLKEYASTLI
jgi:hypothetical protein